MLIDPGQPEVDKAVMAFVNTLTPTLYDPVWGTIQCVVPSKMALAKSWAL